MAPLRWITALLLMTQLYSNGMAADRKTTSTNTIKPSHPFLSVETSCSTDSLLIMASLNEPFYGQLYAKGYATTPTCRVEGAGSRLLKLALNVSECGVRIVEMNDGSRQLDLSLYVQYDRHVQQAVDEHIHTRCVLSQPNGVASESAASSTEAPSSKTAVTDEENVQRNSVLLSAVEKIARRSESHDNNKNLLVTARPVTSAPLSFKSAPAILHDKKNATSTTSAPTRAPTTAAPPPAKESVTCWMDIIAGTDPNSRPVENYLTVGQEATLVVKVRQPAGLDTRLTSCVAHDGSHESQQDLLDVDGCAVDASILPNVLERTNSRSGIKMLYANFNAFKFPDRDHLHFKCTVVVCKGKCPLNTCNLIRRKGRDVKTAVGSISIDNQSRSGIMRLLNVRDLKESNIHTFSSTGRLNERGATVVTRPSLRSSNLTHLIQTLQNFGAVVNKIAVFNSVEVRAPQLEEAPRTMRGGSLSDSSEEYDFISSEAIFCLTPSKLFLAFGVLFALLISAMLFAVCICIRIKSKREKKRLVVVRSPQQRYVNGPPPPVSAVNYAVRAPSMQAVNRQQQQTHIQRQLSRHNSASPYYRVFQ